MTVEAQYQELIEHDRNGREPLGLMTSHAWANDPKRLAFTLSRYKFAAKMLAGSGHVLEVGCADAFGTRIVQQFVHAVTVVDFDKEFIDDVRDRSSIEWPMRSLVHDMVKDPMPHRFDGIYALDVIEHINPVNEKRFITNISKSLVDVGGVVIIGTPSLESQMYASPISRAGHVNCYSGAELRRRLLGWFHIVMMFSMNDEVVHTGFDKMANYLFAVCCEKRAGATG